MSEVISFVLRLEFTLRSHIFVFGEKTVRHESLVSIDVGALPPQPLVFQHLRRQRRGTRD